MLKKHPLSDAAKTPGAEKASFGCWKSSLCSKKTFSMPKKSAALCGALTFVCSFVFVWLLYIIHSLLMLLQDSWLLETVGASCPSPLVARGHF